MSLTTDPPISASVLFGLLRRGHAAFVGCPGDYACDPGRVPEAIQAEQLLPEEFAQLLGIALHGQHGGHADLATHDYLLLQVVS